MGEVRRPTYTTVDRLTGEKVTRQSRVWWVRYYRNGKRHEESSGSTKKGDAERLLRLREGDVAKGLPVTAAVGRLRFDEAAEAVVADARANGRRTAEQTERRIKKHLAPVFGGRRMAAITTADVTKYTAERQAAGAKAGTINRELQILRRAFRLAERAGLVLHRPHVPMLEEDNVRTGFFERDEFDGVRAALPEALRGVVTFAYLTGWRVPSEILTLQWKAVDRTARVRLSDDPLVEVQGVIRLEPGSTKNRKGRTLAYGLLPELEEVIETAWKARQRLAAQGTITPWVFHRDGEQIRSIRKAWSNACTHAGVPGKIPHDFRRTAARNLIRAGVPESVAMKVTGHVTPSVFRRYDIVTEKDIAQGLGMLAPKPEPKAEGKEKGKEATSGRVRQIR